MKKIKTLCLLGLANLECPAEAVELEEAEKKYRKNDIVKFKGKTTTVKNDIKWFLEYEKVHRLLDEDLRV